jgi:prenylated cyclic peptide (anacyclamide/piricyclamide family)
MTKKNLKPQQAAPVQREIKGNQQYHFLGYVAPTITNLSVYGNDPFAGDDAE